jgi:hypothetical protein
MLFATAKSYTGYLFTITSQKFLGEGEKSEEVKNSSEQVRGIFVFSLLNRCHSPKVNKIKEF